MLDFRVTRKPRLDLPAVINPVLHPKLHVAEQAWRECNGFGKEGQTQKENRNEN
jgi:hypothetical protein